MAEKTEKPTVKKKRDSAKKGQTFKSRDLITTIVLVAGIFYLVFAVDFYQFAVLFQAAALHNEQMQISDYLAELTLVFFEISYPFIALCVIAGMAATLLQTKFTIASEAIRLNFKSLNPVEGFKKIFSMRTVKEFVKSLCYLAVLVCTCYYLIHHELPAILSVYKGNISQLISAWSLFTLKTVLAFLAWSVFVLIADFIAEYFLHFKDLKMDKHEVKQEHKETDGNPQIKSARRRAHMEILSGEERAAIRNSEVILANPTHIAIGIYFNPEVAMLPFIALRCTNMKARAAIAYAELTGVPVIRYVSLTRKLFRDYKQYSFISINDEALMEVINILIWLRQVENAEVSAFEQADINVSNDMPAQVHQHSSTEQEKRPDQ